MSLLSRTDPRTTPAYSVSDAARYLRIPAPTVRSWAFGRQYPTRKGSGHFPPVVTVPDKRQHLLSFVNLIELSALRALRTEHAFKLSAVREALGYAKRELGVDNLLASEDLYTKPGALFLAHYGQLIDLNRAGQLGIKAVLDGLLTRIQFNRGLAVRLFPVVPSRTEARTVMLDPRVSFGRPVLVSCGVTTSAIVDRINAGEEPKALAKDYGTNETEIMDALAYERAA